MPSANPLFPTGLGWETVKRRARKLQKARGLNYTAAFVEVAEENAVVLPTIDSIRSWLEARQGLFLANPPKYVPPKKLRELQREQLFVLTYDLRRQPSSGDEAKVWYYCHVIPCGSCQHENRGAIIRADAEACMDCGGLGYKLWPVRTQGIDLNLGLLTPVMLKRLEALSREPTARDMTRDFFPDFVVRTSEVGDDLMDQEERDSPEIAYNGRGAGDADNPDIYENPLYN